MSRKLADLMEGLDFFQDFTYPELETLSRHFSLVSAAKNEIIFNEGDPGSFMLILLDGRISIYKGGDRGRHLLSCEGRGRVIGEMALLDRERRSAQCVAETPCELLSISHAALEKLAAEHPRLAYRFIYGVARLLSRRLRRTSGVLAEHLLD